MVACRGDAFDDLAPEQVVGFYCYYDTKGDDQFEWGLLGEWNGSELIGKKKFHGRDDFLRWRMQTYTTDDGFDDAPNSGGYFKYKL